MLRNPKKCGARKDEIPLEGSSLRLSIQDQGITLLAMARTYPSPASLGPQFEASS